MDHDEVSEQESTALADTDLVLRTRSGDRSAFGELWRRHYRAGVTVARNMTSSLDPDDLVQEAYTRIYQSIVAGGGPTGSFRAYLFTSIRNTAAAWGRARRETAYDELDGVEDPAAEEHASEAALDRGLTHRAFQSLPTRWQEVLWYSEIEQMKPAEIAPLLGMKATAVAQLTFRAREGLREAWIQAHLRSVADGSECQWTIERLGAYARLNLGRRDHAKLERHLAECVRCSIVAGEAKEVSSRLALVLLPLAVGAVGTASYLAVVQGGSAPLTALAAMPSSVVHGAVTGAPGGMAVVAGGGSAAGTGAAAGTGVGAGAAAAGATAGATTIGTVATTAAATVGVAGGSALAGLGAASGLAAASLVVVGGVVAAAVVLPTAAPEPSPAPVTVTDVGPAAPALVPEPDADDFTLLLPLVPGTDPADLPVSPVIDDTATTGTASGTTADAPASGSTGGGNGNAFAGTGNAAGSNTGGTSNGNANGSSGSDTGTGTGTNGNGNGNANGAGNGNGNTDSSGNGTPTNGTGSGNGGVTGNDGVTGNGTPTNGTGNGNGGVTGAGEGNATGAAKKSETVPQSQPRNARKSATAEGAAPPVEADAATAAAAAPAHAPQGDETKTSAESAIAVTDDTTPASPPQS